MKIYCLAALKQTATQQEATIESLEHKLLKLEDTIRDLESHVSYKESHVNYLRSHVNYEMLNVSYQDSRVNSVTCILKRNQIKMVITFSTLILFYDHFEANYNILSLGRGDSVNALLMCFYLEL